MTLLYKTCKVLNYKLPIMQAFGNSIKMNQSIDCLIILID